MQDTIIEQKTTLNFGGKLQDINVPKVLGILNATPDSFYDGGKNNTIDLSIKNVKKMLTDGADIIDVGAYSSRPGAKHISVQEETDRLLPIINAIISEFPDTLISVDTFRSEVAQAAIEAGALIINDISGGNLDPEIWNVAATYKTPYIAMHMQGTPQNMQVKPTYHNVVKDIIQDFSRKVSGMIKAGIMDIIIDPGFGFGKTLEQNYSLLKHLDAFKILGHPILAGVSRKSMIYQLLDTDSQNALNGTTAVHMLALQQGATFLRVHDVKEAKQAIKIWETYNISQ